MSITSSMVDIISNNHMLNSAFYQAWQQGNLKKDDLRYYVGQYFHFENNFPRYLSAIHTQSTDQEVRKIILDNLIDEERGEENHLELWLRFGESLDMDRNDIINTAPNEATSELLSTYEELSNSSIGEGAAALFAYESQIPEVSETKIEGLKKFYGITEKRGLEFFEVHKSADEWHSKECADIIEKKVPSEEHSKSLIAVEKARDSLVKFLDTMPISA